MNKSIIYLHISAGRGPAECCLVVAQVAKAIEKSCHKLNFTYLVMEAQKGRNKNTFSSVLIKIAGQNAKVEFESWQGTIQWIGKSPFRTNHKRKNWFIGLTFLDLPTEMSFSEKDLKFQTFRASGPGGQHRNKVETAVRVVHHPSGISVTATDSKSQQQNKQSAISKMKEKFVLLYLQEERKRIDDQWKDHLSLERGNAVKVFYGEKFKLKT